MNTATEFIHIVNVIHPIPVDVFQQHDAFQFAHGVAVLFFFPLIDEMRPTNEFVCQLTAFGVFQFLRGHMEIPDTAEPAVIIFLQTVKIPFVV